jgi:hypothetical protein
MKASDVQGKAYLEMRCHVRGEPDGVEHQSKGSAMPLTGTSDWASYETSFAVPDPHQVDCIKLNLVIEGQGTLWVRDVEVLRGSLAK